MGTGENCQLFREQLSDQADGDVEEIDLAALDAHCRECAPCRAESVLLAGLAASLRQIPEDTVPADFSRRIMVKLRVDPFPARFWRALGEILTWKPAVALAGGLALLLLVVGNHNVPHPAGPGAPTEVTAFSRKPLWWGGPLVVNDRAHPPTESGRFVISPGDSIRTEPGVSLQLAYGPGVSAESRGRVSLILKNDGLFLTEGRVKVSIDHAGSTADTFKVATANATVVHLGTVFSVEFANQKTRTEVFQGAVRVFTSSGSSEELRAGQAGQVDSTGTLGIEPVVAPAPGARNASTGPENVSLIGR